MKSIASHNGLAATEKAMLRLHEEDAPLDAIIAGIELVEDDPDELTVGYGGLPNESGVVQLDAAVMDGRTHLGGGVAAIENIRHPTRLAKLVMEQTDRVLLTGEGALEFARVNGFPEENLLTDKARQMWLHWRRARGNGHDDWKAPDRDDLELDLQHWFDTHFYRPTGTVHCSALDQAGNIACATSTSGHAFKLPGRVGDSPLLGAGLYCDNAVGSCGSIGHGESNMRNCSSFLVVELMRNGMSPCEAGVEALSRIAENCPPYLRRENGDPNFNVQLFILSREGEHAGVALQGRKEIAVSDADGSRLELCTSLIEGSTGRGA